MNVSNNNKPKVYSMGFDRIYQCYIEKAEKKGKSKEEVDKILRWISGYTQKGLESQIKKQTDLETFIKKYPKPNPNRKLISGTICGVKINEIKDKTMKEIRYMDKLIDELSKGKSMESILRKK